MDEELTYPQQVHELYAAAIKRFRAQLCSGALGSNGSEPNLTVICSNNCGQHEVEVDVRAVRRFIIDVNTAAHALLKVAEVLPTRENEAAYHEGLLDLSRDYFSMLDELILEKEAIRLEKWRAKRRRQRQSKNLRTKLLLTAEEASPKQLSEFMACYRKHRHVTRADAVESLEDGLHGSDANNEVYACSYCDNWHVGHAASKTAPPEYRLSRARMVWSTQRSLANEFVKHRAASDA